MDNEKKIFRDNLLATEQITPALEEKYKKEIQAMFEEKLSGPKRFGFNAIAVIRLVLAIQLAYLAVFSPYPDSTFWRYVSPTTPFLRILFGFFALFLFFIAVYVPWVTRKGTLNLKSHANRIAWLKYGFLMVTGLVFYLYAASLPGIAPMLLVTVPIIFYLLAAVVIIYNKVTQSELLTRERLLRMELSLSEISEKLGIEPGKDKP
jgi:hypothetical protein